MEIAPLELSALTSVFAVPLRVPLSSRVKAFSLGEVHSLVQQHHLKGVEGEGSIEGFDWGSEKVLADREVALRRGEHEAVAVVGVVWELAREVALPQLGELGALRGRQDGDDEGAVEALPLVDLAAELGWGRC